MNNLVKRTITGAVFVSVVVGSILQDFNTLMVLFGVVSMIGTWEFVRMMGKSHYSLQKATAILLALFMYVLGVAVLKEKLPLISLGILIPIYFGCFVSELFRNRRYAISNIAITLTIPFYTTLPFLLLLQSTLSGGTYDGYLLIGVLILIWSNDTFAYLIGRQLGKTKLFERISPKKTWEGSLGGFVVAMLIAIFLLPRFFTSLSMIDWIIIGVISVVFGSIGDLIESLIKRTLKVKDSGSILPGHGGVLDRFDALIGAAPFIYTYLVVIKGMLS